MKLRKILRLTDEERRLLARPAFIAGGIFLAFTLLVITGLINPLDIALVTDLRHSEPWTDKMFKVLESPGQRRFVYPAAILLSMVFTIRRKDLLPMIATVSSLVFTNAVTGMFKLATLRGFPRRTDNPGVFNTDFGDLADLGAFPSGHATNIAAASTLMVLAAYSARPRYRPYATHITVITGMISFVTFISSWLRDTHWVSDLLAGFALGICTTIVATMWAIHLPDHWRHPELAGRPRLVIFTVGVTSMAAIFMFAGNSFLSHSGTSAVLVIGTLGFIARQSQQSIKRAVARSRQNREQKDS
ncbi:MAG: superfamily [Actinomycetota bacterium]